LFLKESFSKFYQQRKSQASKLKQKFTISEKNIFVLFLFASTSKTAILETQDYSFEFEDKKTVFLKTAITVYRQDRALRLAISGCLRTSGYSLAKVGCPFLILKK